MRRTTFLTSILLAGVLMFGLGRANADELKIGQEAPDFTAACTDGSQVNLKSIVGKEPIVLYFYPKDDTPGCTKEACGIRDDFSAFKNLNARVYGISYDSIDSHKKFIEKYHLPFALLSDSNHTIAKRYGADGLLFAKRMTFVIDRSGKIAWMDRSVNPSTHSKELQDALSKLPA